MVGLYGGPTVINNVETLATCRRSCARGAGWFTAIGTEQSKGTRLFCLSGHVERPGNYELPLGTPLRTLIDEFGGGVWHGKRAQGGHPGRVLGAVPRRRQLDTPLDFEAVAAAGSMLGSGGIVVFDEDTCIVRRRAAHDRVLPR